MSGITLEKGQKITLEKRDGSNLTKAVVGLGWDVRTTEGKDFDLDVSIFAVGENGRVESDRWFIFYNQLRAPEDVIVHTGDNLTGEGEGDDEQIKVDLEHIPSFVEKLVIVVSIHDAEERNQNFGGVMNSFVRICDQNDREVVRYDLREDFHSETCVVFGEVFREGGSWTFRALGQGRSDNLLAICREHGVNA